MSHYTALTCEALARSVYAAAATSPHVITVRLFRQGLHNHPRNLRVVLQEQIDALSADEGEAHGAILLAYGMCGLATVGLTARRVPLVMPRAHDCITLYLGSHERYQAEFARHPGTYWYSVDYLERQTDGNDVALGAATIATDEAQYQKYVEKYGQETADELMEEMRKWAQHYTRAAFIDLGLGDQERYAHIAQAKAQKEGWIYERLQGNRRLLEMLVGGDWNPDLFLVVPPGHTIRQSYTDGVVEAGE